MYKRLYTFLNNNKIIHSLQFRFRQQYSISLALINITEYKRKAHDDESMDCGVFVDLQNDFDTVDNQILLAKLNHYAIRGVSNDWFKSYLSNRSQYESLNKYECCCCKLWCPSRICSKNSAIFIDIKDLNRAIKLCQVHHFADDTNLLWLKNCIKKLKKIVNTELKHPSNWLDVNEISLNVKKTEIVIFKSMPKKLKVLQR